MEPTLNLTNLIMNLKLDCIEMYEKYLRRIYILWNVRRIFVSFLKKKKKKKKKPLWSHLPPNNSLMKNMNTIKT
jgi:hypothetical protein